MGVMRNEGVTATAWTHNWMWEGRGGAGGRGSAGAGGRGQLACRDVPLMGFGVCGKISP